MAKDPSTGFYQRHYFLEQLTGRLASQQAGGIRALAYIRPDHFARVQSDVGLLGTEALLMRLAELLRELMQPGDLYGRFGGTMFTVLVERGTMTDVQAWANQVRKAVANQVFEVETQSTSMSCTIGLCEVRPSDQNPGELLAEAEHGLPQGPGPGRQSRGTQRSTERDGAPAPDGFTLWIARIRAALMQNRLRLVHQPVVGLHEEVQGVLDTRVRLIDEQGEPVLPADFIPAAERAHMMKNIDRWVIGASFSFCVARQPNLVFVRLSRDSVLDDSLHRVAEGPGPEHAAQALPGLLPGQRGARPAAAQAEQGPGGEAPGERLPVRRRPPGDRPGLDPASGPPADAVRQGGRQPHAGPAPGQGPAEEGGRDRRTGPRTQDQDHCRAGGECQHDGRPLAARALPSCRATSRRPTGWSSAAPARTEQRPPAEAGRALNHTPGSRHDPPDCHDITERDLGRIPSEPADGFLAVDTKGFQGRTHAPIAPASSNARMSCFAMAIRQVFARPPC